jgi:hypothetical protein
MGWMPKKLQSDSQQGQEISLFSTIFRLALVLIKPPLRGVPEALSLGEKQPRLEADHSPSSTDGLLKMCGATPPFPMPSWLDTLFKHMHSFI